VFLCYNHSMEKISDIELNKLSKAAVIALYTQMSESLETLSEQYKYIQKQNEKLSKQIDDLTEKLAILTMQRFGKKTETAGQLSFDLENQCILNEAEKLTEKSIPNEPEFEEVIVKRKKRKGKWDIDLEGLDVEVVNHECIEDELKKEFPKGWHTLDDEIYRELQYIPAKFKVLEHHVKVYAENQGSEIILRAPKPNRLLDHSLLTPELASAVFNAKYVNAVPLNRLSEEFLRNDVNISRQNMAGWMIRLAEYYLEPIHVAMRDYILSTGYIHCDETPFTMPEHSKEYMWVFHSPGGAKSYPVYLYEYLGSRNGNVIAEYLKGYKGVLITDGYQPYHTLSEKEEDIRVAGCWAHARRRFAEIVKTVKKGAHLSPVQKVAVEAVQRIDTMYHIVNRFKETSAKERLENRKQSVSPLVDAYFEWVKEQGHKVSGSTKLTNALTYSVNQEKYLREFLTDAEIPLDNNDAERSIKAFCAGKHSWHIIDSEKGAKSSALLYSIAETAKANNLKPYEYFVHLLTELQRHPRDRVPKEVLQKVMPWSEDIPKECRKTKTR